MKSEMVPYLILLLAVLATRFSRAAGLIILLGAMLVGLDLNVLEPIACVAILVTGVFAFWHKHDLAFVILLMLAIALENYLLPGFHNLKVLDQVRFASDSRPFTMYLNFDKVVAGLLIYIFVLRAKAPDWKWVGITTGALILLMMPLALVIHFVRFDPKFPSDIWIWALNNLFFVALSEEALYRGLIQGRLEERLPAWAAIVIAALLFALAHYKGGVVYMALAGVAGLFYGFVYHRTRALESSMLTHFGLNLTHFLLFSYPALQK